MPITADRRLADWHPLWGPLERWLTGWAEDGWLPEYGYGVYTSANARWRVRWAMVKVGSPSWAGVRAGVRERLERNLVEALVEHDVEETVARELLAAVLAQVDAAGNDR